MAKKNKIQEFYDSLQSVSKLVGDLALNIAEAQTRLDEAYIRTLGEYSQVLRTVIADRDLSTDQFIAFFKSLAPSRYQFTETVVEVRADLQLAGGSEVRAAAEVGYTTPVLAATVNASYVNRSAYDYRAAALIKTVLHAVPPDPDVLQKLLDRAGETPEATLPENSRFEGLAAAFSGLLGSSPEGSVGDASNAGGGAGGGSDAGDGGGGATDDVDVADGSSAFNV
ncbi:MAG: hypothetical protein GY719_06105 [bacterium]|nr:hypothetical protein [bacterium]